MADLGEGPGSPPFLDQTEAGRAEKIPLETAPPPPLFQGLNLALKLTHFLTVTMKNSENDVSSMKMLPEPIT